MLKDILLDIMVDGRGIHEMEKTRKSIFRNDL